MAVKIRLARFGRRNRPYYRIVVTDSRNKRDGRSIESVGSYDPISGTITSLKKERLEFWRQIGAEISPTVKRILRAAENR